MQPGGKPWQRLLEDRQVVESLAKSKGLLLDEQRLAFLTSTSSVDVQAAPGAGKTTLVGLKLCLLARAWSSPATGICVLSHTNTAKNEIRKVLESDDHGGQLLNYPHFI